MNARSPNIKQTLDLLSPKVYLMKTKTKYRFGKFHFYAVKMTENPEPLGQRWEFLQPTQIRRQIYNRFTTDFSKSGTEVGC